LRCSLLPVLMFGQATKSLERALEALVTLEHSSSPVPCLLTFIPDSQQLLVTSACGSNVLFEGDLKTAIAVVGGHYPNAWSGSRCPEDLLFRRMRFAVLWERHTLAIEAATRDAQELWVTNLNAVMQLQVGAMLPVMPVMPVMPVRGLACGDACSHAFAEGRGAVESDGSLSVFTHAVYLR
jgi:hypothetical protein